MSLHSEKYAMLACVCVWNGTCVATVIEVLGQSLRWKWWSYFSGECNVTCRSSLLQFDFYLFCCCKWIIFCYIWHLCDRVAHCTPQNFPFIIGCLKLPAFSKECIVKLVTCLVNNELQVVRDFVEQEQIWTIVYCEIEQTELCRGLNVFAFLNVTFPSLCTKITCTVNSSANLTLKSCWNVPVKNTRSYSDSRSKMSIRCGCASVEYD
jgi:hypothetical protein